LTFSPNGDLLAGAGKGGVQLWDVPSHEPIGERLGSFPASSIAVSPDGSQVIVGDSAGVVQAYPATIDGWLSSACALVSRNLSQRERDSYLGSEAPDQTACPEYG
jgi:WD40 repeat protein